VTFCCSRRGWTTKSHRWGKDCWTSRQWHPRDRSERGFHRYVQLGMLGRNLHVPGKLLIARYDATCLAAHSRRKKAAT
jgi:hypothetical protein